MTWRRLTAVGTMTVATLSLAACGNDAVSTSIPLSSLGTSLVEPATQTLGMVTSGTPGAQQKVSDDGTQDHACPGGHRREYAASVSGPFPSSQSRTDVRNSLNVITQAELKPAGVKVTTDLGKDASTVPDTIAFASTPQDDAKKLTYRTVFSSSGSTFTWKLTGKTACVTTK